jgi:hypothetical protein
LPEYSKKCALEIMDRRLILAVLLIASLSITCQTSGSSKSDDASHSTPEAPTSGEEPSGARPAAEPDPRLSVSEGSAAEEVDWNWTKIEREFSAAWEAPTSVDPQRLERMHQVTEALISALRRSDAGELPAELAARPARVVISPGEINPWAGTFERASAMMECVTQGRSRPAECSSPYPDIPFVSATEARCDERCCQLARAPVPEGASRAVGMRSVCFEFDADDDSIEQLRIWFQQIGV